MLKSLYLQCRGWKIERLYICLIQYMTFNAKGSGDRVTGIIDIIRTASDFNSCHMTGHMQHGHVVHKYRFMLTTFLLKINVLVESYIDPLLSIISKKLANSTNGKTSLYSAKKNKLL